MFVFEYVTGGGAIDGPDDARRELLPAGLAMRDAVAGDLSRAAWAGVPVELSVAVGAGAPDAPPGASAVSPAPSESLLDFVAREAERHDLCWVIAPETGRVLAHFQEAVGPRRWLGCDRAAITLTTSKRATARRLAEHGIVTPLAFEHAPETARWIVKPDDGAGALASRVHTDDGVAFGDWQRRSGAGTPMAIEPWVDGEALSLSLHCRRGAPELLSVNRQHIGVSAAGELSFDGVDVDVMALDSARGSVLRRLADQVARAVPGLGGFVGIDLVWHPRRGPVVIEINPRVTTAYAGLSVALGRNLGAELVRARLAESLDADA